MELNIVKCYSNVNILIEKSILDLYGNFLTDCNLEQKPVFVFRKCMKLATLLICWFVLQAIGNI